MISQIDKMKISRGDFLIKDSPQNEATFDRGRGVGLLRSLSYKPNMMVGFVSHLIQQKVVKKSKTWLLFKTNNNLMTKFFVMSFTVDGSSPSSANIFVYKNQGRVEIILFSNSDNFDKKRLLQVVCSGS